MTYLLFLDDAVQKNCSRQGVGNLVAVGGFVVAIEIARTLELALDKLCGNDFGFPGGEAFKWSPPPEYWMRENLIEDEREEFFQAALQLAAEHGVTGLVTIEDANHAKAIKETPNHELDVIVLMLERFHWMLRDTDRLGIVIAARPSGGRSDEDKFLAKCFDFLQVGTRYVAFDRIATNLLTAPFRGSRLLQLADLIVSCTTAIVAGHSKYSEPIFPSIRAILRSAGGRKGGVGLKIHPDFCYVNLYHWLLEDDTYWRLNTGWQLPMRGRPYGESPQRV